MQVHGLFDKKNDSGLIIHADDQYINQQSIKINLQDIGLGERFVMRCNGQEVVDFFDELFDGLNLSGSTTPRQPVSLLLLDINMPILTGMETLILIK